MSEKRRRTYTNGPCTTVLVEYDDGGVTLQQWQAIGGTSQVIALLSSEWEDMRSGLQAPADSEFVVLRSLLTKMLQVVEEMGWPDLAADEYALLQKITGLYH